MSSFWKIMTYCHCFSSKEMKKESTCCSFRTEFDFRFLYCLTTNFNEFMSRQFKNKTYSQKFCQRCLHGFSSQTVLIEHLKLCGQHSAVSIKMPPSESFISFRHWYKTSMCPYTIYADIEALCKSKDAK